MAKAKTKQPAASFHSLGGKATFKKYGPGHMAALAKRRWRKAEREAKKRLQESA
jgi:hypothetical protein